MLTEYPPEMPWAIVQLKTQWFAIATRCMREMLVLPELAAIPDVPDYVRGVMNLRGRVVPIIDLRKRIGMASAAGETDAFCNLMAQREQDHRNWLGELEASVRERRKFALTADPHKCAFGKWYDAYRAGNVWVTALLSKFDQPHRQIHGVAAQVQEAMAAGKPEQAGQLIEETRGSVLRLMIQLFAELKNLVREVRRETAVVLAVSGRTFAVSVDAAVSIEKLVPGSVAPLPAGALCGPQGVVQRVGQRGKHPQPIMLIEADRILGSSFEMPAA